MKLLQFIVADFTITYVNTYFTFCCYTRKFDWEVCVPQMEGTGWLATLVLWKDFKYNYIVPGTTDWFNYDGEDTVLSLNLFIDIERGDLNFVE